MDDRATPLPAREPSSGPDTRYTRATLEDDAEDEQVDSSTVRTQLDSQERSIVEAARRDRSAFTPLYHRYVTPMYRYFYQQVTSVEDAEDLTATTFSKALDALDRYQMRGSFAAWLFGIARHTLYDHERARYASNSGSTSGLTSRVDIQEIESALADPAPGPEAQLLQSEQATDLRRLVARLPDEQRDALVLRIFGELSVRDVAAILGKSDGAVKMLVHRAVETLRASYGTSDREI